MTQIYHIIVFRKNSEEEIIETSFCYRDKQQCVASAVTYVAKSLGSDSRNCLEKHLQKYVYTGEETKRMYERLEKEERDYIDDAPKFIDSLLNQPLHKGSICTQIQWCYYDILLFELTVSN